MRSWEKEGQSTTQLEDILVVNKEIVFEPAVWKPKSRRRRRGSDKEKIKN
jgi:hypothetical protein